MVAAPSAGGVWRPAAPQTQARVWGAAALQAKANSPWFFPWPKARWVYVRSRAVLNEFPQKALERLEGGPSAASSHTLVQKLGRRPGTAQKRSGAVILFPVAFVAEFGQGFRVCSNGRGASRGPGDASRSLPSEAPGGPPVGRTGGPLISGGWGGMGCLFVAEGHVQGPLRPPPPPSDESSLGRPLIKVGGALLAP